ncbi:MAG TPA: hypothetical protein VMZ91_15695 [Candidatus Paceibacterota bacterium]|nr:hypothetical protein [Candidatus Paceibacterota bacterium]
MSEYTGLSYDEILKILRERKGKHEQLNFHPSPDRYREIDLDEPESMGDLEEELSGP